MKKSDFWFDLPEELIAQTPIEPRDASRVMLLDKETGATGECVFHDIIDRLNPGDLLVLNNSRVLPARLYGYREGTGGHMEFLLLKQVQKDVWEVMVRPGKKAREGLTFEFGDGRLKAEVLSTTEGGNRLVRFHYDGEFYSLLEEIGNMPLPHYITAELKDKERYQTVYSKDLGSAAAPTAGLHFTKELLERIEQKGVGIAYVTLHVGLGTFRPVKTEEITDHQMHSEHYYITPETAEKINRTKEHGGRVIAVGTTSCRTLESAADENGRIHECSNDTSIFIYPGYKFKVLDGLITNFHLPESTLIMLVSALAGYEHTMAAYKEAVEKKFRFYSFGDAMFIADQPDLKEVSMYKLIKKQGNARRGEFQTVHGTVQTPAFMNVGTSAAIKGGISSYDLKDLKCQVELCNTYHLHLRPGDDVIRDLGGLHKFMGWDRPILTDSGGFQVFSLSSLRKIEEEGVYFQSHIDGRRIFMGPEESMRVQSNLASTIAMAFDECIENPSTREYTARSIARTVRWLERCKKEMERLNSLPETINKNQLLFGINQGSTFEDLRIEHMKQIADLDLDGYAIGGLAVGETAEEMYRIIEAVEPYMPADKIRYLMGVGTPVNILEAVARGVDLFDCVMPSRNARHGHIFTWDGVINLINAKYQRDDRPIDEHCDCPVCRQHSRAYIRHLLKAGEMLGMRLAVMHNLYFYNTLMERIRESLDNGTFDAFYAKYVPILGRRI